MATAIAQGLLFVGSDRTQEVDDETGSVSFSGQCLQTSWSKEGCGGWASLTNNALTFNPGSALCTLHPGMGELGLEPSRRGAFSFIQRPGAAADRGPECSFLMGRDGTSLLWGPIAPVFLHHSKDYCVVPVGPSHCLPPALSSGECQMRMNE